MTTFPRKHVTFHEPDEETIAFLKGILAQAEKGELRSIAVACVYSDEVTPAGSSSTGWSRASGCRHMLGYAIQQLQHRWCVHMDDPATP